MLTVSTSELCGFGGAGRNEITERLVGLSIHERSNMLLRSRNPVLPSTVTSS